MTALDDAYRAMADAPDDDDAPRLRFYERLADGELFLLLEKEAERDHIEPRLFDLEDGMFALVFDRERRLADFTGGAAPFAALSGRVAVAMLQGRGIGLGVNLNAPSAILLPPEAVDWLHGTLGAVPTEAKGVPEEIRPPAGVPARLLEGLDAKAPAMAGLARAAYLAGVTWKDGRRGHLLAFVDVAPGAEDGLARAAGETLVFSGLEAGEMDVAFIRPSDAMAGRLARVALRIELPEPPRAAPPKAPGSDGPPRLR